MEMIEKYLKLTDEKNECLMDNFYMKERDCHCVNFKDESLKWSN